MGRSITPTFRLEGTAVGDADGRRFPILQAWETKYAGRPSDATLAAHVKVAEAATLPGGVNAHLGAERITTARVVRQSTGEVVATFTAPMFAVA